MRRTRVEDEDSVILHGRPWNGSLFKCIGRRWGHCSVAHQPEQDFAHTLLLSLPLKDVKGMKFIRCQWGMGMLFLVPLPRPCSERWPACGGSCSKEDSAEEFSRTGQERA